MQENKGPKYNMRNAVAADAEKMAELDKLCFHAPWTLNMFKEELETNRLAIYLVLEDEENNLIGYVGLWAIGDEGHITNVAIHPDHRRKQLAQQMVAMLIDATTKIGLNKYTLEARVSNEGAIALYEKLGFMQAGIRPKYYEDNGEDAVIMWRYNV